MWLGGSWEKDTGDLNVLSLTTAKGSYNYLKITFNLEKENQTCYFPKTSFSHTQG